MPVFGMFGQSDRRWIAPSNSGILDVNVRAVTDLYAAFFPRAWSVPAAGHPQCQARLRVFLPGDLAWRSIYASKAYVLSFTEALQSGAWPARPCEVTALCPGPVSSEIPEACRFFEPGPRFGDPETWSARSGSHVLDNRGLMANKAHGAAGGSASRWCLSCCDFFPRGLYRQRKSARLQLRRNLK